ncbi:exodeoxyribonuclease VII large subunit, partial [Pelomonas sp. KK5]|uniref:exodeoxyribonuclease VII large subunit n=1 Tax=Pelomonas sp. KK5 TaxID=1855730 RepID=UPI0026F457B3
VLPRRQLVEDQRLRHLDQRASRSLPAALRSARQRLDALGARLAALDPHAVLSRGYAWLDDGQGSALVSVEQLQTGGEVTAVLADGRARMQVLDKLPTISAGPNPIPQRRS